MYLVVAHNWKQPETAAEGVAKAMAILLFEARQKIAGEGPRVLASFADCDAAEDLAGKLEAAEVPALILETRSLRENRKASRVQSFSFEDDRLSLSLEGGLSCELPYRAIDTLLVATAITQLQPEVSGKTKRKLSIGKTLLAGGVPMRKNVKGESRSAVEEREQVLWLYNSIGPVLIFERGGLDYSGLGDALQLSRDLNFNGLLKQLRQRAPAALFDDRLLRRGDQCRVLGPLLSPEADLDLACEILARTLRPKP